MAGRRSTGLRMFLPLLALLALAVAWSVWWYVVYTTARQHYAEQEERLAAQGTTLSCAAQDWGGYPFRVEMTCREARLAVESGGHTTVASAASLTALVQAYNPTHGLILLTGPTTVAPPGGAAPVTVAHGPARASVRWQGEERLQVSFEAPDVVSDGFGKAASVLLHARLEGTDRIDFAGSATGLSLALGGGKTLALDRADLDVAVPAALLRASDPLRLASQTSASVEIKRLEARQDPLSASAAGTLSLDAEGRLNGTLSTTVSDLDLLLERATAQLALKPEDVSAARALLGVLKATGSRIDIVAKAGKLYWGPIPLAEIPPFLE